MTAVDSNSRIVITGVTGFVGRVLARHLSISGYNVVGISQNAEPPSDLALVLAEYHSVDLSKRWPNIGPADGLVHLAGRAAVGPSFDNPQDYIQTNSSMVTNLFEHALARKWQGRAVVVSSGAIYGPALNGDPLTEQAPVAATSPYVISKLLVEYQAEYYRRRGIDVLLVRPFNHIGPEQRHGFIVPDLTEKVVSLEPDSRLEVGNLDSARDYTDVRDIVTAYEALLRLPSPDHGVYNVCSGRAHEGWAVLRAVCAALDEPVPETVVKSYRAIDPSVITGSAERLKRETGWEPTINLERSVRDYARSVGNVS